MASQVFEKPDPEPAMPVPSNEHKLVESSSMTDNEKSPSPQLQPGEDEHTYLTGIKLYLVLACATAASFLMLLDLSILATAIPRITSQFHSLPDVGWYGSAYQLARYIFLSHSGLVVETNKLKCLSSTLSRKAIHSSQL